jgi:transcriptional/translational regulatory protein YebC/TACO1
MPKDNIENAIKRGAGTLEGVNYEEIRYEGYGISGAAVIVDCLTDNRNRAVADVRHAFTKFGGNLGTDGSVAFMFKHCGSLLFAPGTSEDKVMEVALEAGAEEPEIGTAVLISNATSGFPHNFHPDKQPLRYRTHPACISQVLFDPFENFD